MNDPWVGLLIKTRGVRKFFRKMFFRKSFDEKWASQKLQDLQLFFKDAHFIDIIVRKDSKNHTFSGDFLKYLKG